MLKLMIKIRLQAWLSSYGSANAAAASRRRSNSKSRGILYALLFIYLIGIFGYLAYTTFDTLAGLLAALDLGWFYWALAGAGVFSLIFITNLFMTGPQLYQAKDTEMLLAMPLKPDYILISRIFGLWLTNTIFELIILVPAVICWLKYATLSAAGIFSLVIGFILWPLLALALACLAGYAVTLLTSRMKNKTLFSMIFMVLFLAVYYYFCFNAEGLLTQLLADSANISQNMQAILPLVWLGKAVGQGSLTSLLWLSLVCLAVTALVYRWLAVSFIRISLGLKNSTVKTKYKGGPLAVSSIRAALLRKEKDRLVSSSNYMMNAYLSALFLVAGSVYVIIKHQQLAAELAAFSSVKPLFALLASVAICGICSMTSGSASSVSLEGRNIWLLRSLPVNSIDVLTAKAALQIVIMVPLILVTGLVIALSLQFDLISTLFVLVLPALYECCISILGVIINLHHVRLDWINEVQVIKQSAAVMISLLINIVIVILMAVPYLIWLYDLLPEAAYMAVWTVLLTAVAAVSYNYLRHKGVYLFEHIG